jgi:hypothetical protein
MSFPLMHLMAKRYWRKPEKKCYHKHKLIKRGLFWNYWIGFSSRTVRAGAPSDWAIFREPQHR